MDARFKKEYEKRDAVDLAIRVSSKIQEARIFSGLTQQALAKRMKVHQPGIARAERGKDLPSLGFLQKIAEAMGTYLVEPSFGFLEEGTPAKSHSFFSEVGPTKYWEVKAVHENSAMTSKQPLLA